MATVYPGVDISDNQGTINFTTMRTTLGSNGFVIIKASGFESDNEYHTQTTLAAYQTNARASGLYIGYYFYVTTANYSSADPNTAADYFYDSVSVNSGELMILDFDDAGGGFSEAMDAWCNDFLTELSIRFSGQITPIMYSSYSLVNQGPGAWASTSSISKLWIADYSFGETDFSEYVGPWSNNTPNYLLLQYSDAGVGSSYGVSSETIDLDSFYSPNNTMVDFTDLGYAASAGGSLSHATVTNPTTTFTQPELQTIIVPKYNYDHVIFSDTFSGSVSNSGWPQVIDGPTTNINQTAYPMGNFSYDDGQTWQDFGYFVGSDYGTFIGELPVWVIQPVVDNSGDLIFEVTYPNQGINGDTGTHSATFIIHIALLASYQLSILPGSTNLGQQIAYSNLVSGVTPPYATYRRISTDTAVVGGTYPHGLATIPNLLFWQYDTSNDTDIAPSRWSSTGGIGGELGVAMDATNVYIHVDSFTQDVFYRTYLDN